MNGASFDGKHSFTDYGLYMAPKTIPLPDPKTNTVSVEGSDGQLDLSTVLTDGDVKFKNRTLELSFHAIGDGWRTKLDAFAAAVHGQRMQVVFDDDTAHYFYGRVTVDDVDDQKAYGTIKVKVDADPYRYEVAETTVSKAVSGSGTASLPNTRMWVVPSITSTGSIQLTYGGTVYQLAAGTQTVPDLVLKPGTTSVALTGTATVTFAYRKGVL